MNKEETTNFIFVWRGRRWPFTPRAGLLFLMGWAALLRIAMCFQYLGNDETLILDNLRNFYLHRTLLPAHFSYPTFFSYLVALPFLAATEILHLLKIIPNLRGIEALYQTGFLLPILPIRLTSAAIGLLTILLTYRIGQDFYPPRTGLIAAALLTFSGLHLQYSSWGLPDATMAFFAAVSLYFALSALQTRRLRDYLLAGAGAGLATTTKYNGALALLPMILVHLLMLHQEKRLFSLRAVFERKIVLSGLMALAVFLLGSPGWLVAPASFIHGFLFDRHLMAVSQFGQFGPPYLQHFILFWHWENFIAVLFGLGVLYALLRGTRRDFVLLGFCLVSFLYIGSWTKKDLHYLLFLYPALALLAARSVTEVLGRFHHARSDTLWLAVMALSLAWPAYTEVINASHQFREDSRDLGYAWIQQNVPEGSKIMVDFLAFLPRLLDRSKKAEFLTGPSQSFYREALKGVRAYDLIPMPYALPGLQDSEADYLLINSYCFDRYYQASEPAPNSPLFAAFHQQRTAYALLLHSPQVLGWKRIQEFQARRGPRLLLFARSR